MYHLCLLAGLASQRKSEVPPEDTTVLVDYFPGEYRNTGRLIVALFVATELRLMGIDRSERDHLHSEVSMLVDPAGTSFLSDAGMREINRYAHGGFDTISEWFDARPHTFEAFLVNYKEKLDRALSGRIPQPTPA